MADDKTSRGDLDLQRTLLREVQRDLQRIDVSQGYEVRYWCQAFRCTEPQLRWAVRESGPVVGDVRRALCRYLSGEMYLLN